MFTAAWHYNVGFRLLDLDYTHPIRSTTVADTTLKKRLKIRPLYSMEIDKMKFYDADGLVIRLMIESDCVALTNAFQGSHKPLELFRQYFTLQEDGRHLVFIAVYEHIIVGYVLLCPQAPLGPFANQGIPEIVDFNVLSTYRRKGIGSRLLDVAESCAREKADSICLGVGVHSGYGTAQRMYIKRGYIPDGSGVWYKDVQLDQYAPCINDDDLVLYLKKTF